MEQGLAFKITALLPMLKKHIDYFEKIEMMFNSTIKQLENLNKDEYYNGKCRKISNDFIETLEAVTESNKEDLGLMVNYLTYVNKNRKNEIVLVNKSELKSHKGKYDSQLRSLKHISSELKEKRSRSAGKDDFVLSVAYNKLLVNCNLVIADLEVITEKLEDIIKK